MFTLWDKVKSKNIKNIDGVITWIIEKIREQDEQRYWINNRYIWLESDIWCICKECNSKMNYKDRQRIWLKLKLNFNH